MSPPKKPQLPGSLPAQRLKQPGLENQFKPNVAQPKIASAQPGKRPAAPPAYRPQPVPRVLQAKSAVSSRQQVAQPAQKPTAPPVYRPQSVPKVLQAKTPAPQQSVNQSRRAPAAPPVYRPQPVPKALQTKMAASQRPPSGQPQRLPLASQASRMQLSGSVQAKIGGMTQPRNIQSSTPVVRRPQTSAGLPSQPPGTVARKAASVVQPWSKARSGGRGSVVQRVVIPVYNKENPEDEKDYIDWCAKELEKRPDAGRIGGDISNIPNNEKVYLVGHGNVGTMHGYSASELVTKYLSGLSKNYTGSVVLVSCMSGVSDMFTYDLAAQVANILTDAQYKCQVHGLTNSGKVLLGGEIWVVKDEQSNARFTRAWLTYRGLVEHYEQLISDKTLGPKTELLLLESRRLELKMAKRQSSFSVGSLFSGIGSSLGLVKSDEEVLEEEIQKLRVQIDTTERDLRAQRDQDLTPLKKHITESAKRYEEQGATVKYGPVPQTQWKDPKTYWVRSPTNYLTLAEETG